MRAFNLKKVKIHLVALHFLMKIHYYYLNLKLKHVHNFLLIKKLRK